MPGDSGDGSRDHQIDYLLTELRRIAAYYLEVRGCVLGLTNEVGDLEAERQLGLSMVNDPDAGYDAIDKDGVRLCIRSRVVKEVAEKSTICINGLKVDGPWQAVVLVQVNQQYELLSIFRVERADLEAASKGSKKRRKKEPKAEKKQETMAFALSTFLRCARKVWPTET